MQRNGWVNISEISTYLTVLFFDERFNLISASDGGAWQQQVASSVGSNGLPLQTSPGIKAPKNGYVFVYVSNQSNQDVYFDNLAVTISQGNIIEENHYYSFGLKIAAISSKKYTDTYDGDTKNNYQMQGAFSEMDEDIGWNDFALRNYDPQIGRWVQIDPYADNYMTSPYVGISNDPINIVDPSGGETLPYINLYSTIGRLSGEVLPTVVVTAYKMAAPATKAISTLVQVGMKTWSILIKVGQAGEIICKVGSSQQVGGPWTYQELRAVVGRSRTLQTLESRVYNNSASGFKLKDEKGNYVNPASSNVPNAGTSYDLGAIYIPSAYDKNQAAVAYGHELQNAANFERGRKLQSEQRSKKISKDKFVNDILDLDTEGMLSSLQVANELFPGQDVVGRGDNSDLVSKVAKFIKKYLKPGELLSEYKPKPGSKAEKQLQEIRAEARKKMEEELKSEYEKKYDNQ